MIECNTQVSVGELWGNQKIPNITLMDALFWGRSNFAGDPEKDRFKDPRRKFTVQIPLGVAEQVKALGYNVKVTEPDEQQIAEGKEPIASLKVFCGEPTQDKNTGAYKGANITVVQGNQSQRLTVENMEILDRSKVLNMDMEIRGWEYDPEEKPGEFSARLVTLVITIQPNVLAEKYGKLI